MEGFKVGDMVQVRDYSYAVTLSDTGELSSTGHRRNAPAERFRVLATNCMLPTNVGSSDEVSYVNDLVLRNIDNNRVIFSTSAFVQLKARKYTNIEEAFIKLGWTPPKEQ